MPSRSFTFTFNLALLLLALAAGAVPLLLAEKHLIPTYSSQHIQMRLVEYAIEQSKDRKYLLLGDSTIRNFHSSALHIDSDPVFTNLGAGGGMAMEWYYSMRNALRAGVNVKAILVGMWSGDSLEATDSIPPYFPFLLDPKDAWNEYQTRHLSFKQSAFLFLYLHLKLPYTRSDILYGLVSDYLPEMRPFMMNLAVDQVEKAGSVGQTPDSPPPRKRIWGVEQMVALAKEKSIPIRFVLSPTSSALRKNALYMSRRRFFFDTCRELKLQCTDLSSKVPDKFFSADGIHLRGEHLDFYKRMVEELLAKDGRG